MGAQKPRTESHQSYGNEGRSKTCWSTCPISSATAADRGHEMMIYATLSSQSKHWVLRTRRHNQRSAFPPFHMVDGRCFFSLLPPYAGETSLLLIFLFLPAVPGSYLPKIIQTLAICIFSWVVLLGLKNPSRRKLASILNVL